MNEITILIILRLIASCIFAVGAVILALNDKTGWGLCIAAAIILGGITLNTE
jgi:hypothetical protein